MRWKMGWIVGITVALALGAVLAHHWRSPFHRSYDPIRIFKKHMARQKMDMRKYDVVAKPVGSRGHTLIYQTQNDLSPAIPSIYILFSNGYIEPLGPYSLCRAMQDGKRHVTAEEKMDLIRKFIALRDSDSGDLTPSQIIEKTDDIPGYGKAPLDPDLEPIIRAPWTKMQKGDEVWTVCTYRRLGGLVRRYQCHFRSDGEFFYASEMELGMGIGEASYLL